MPEPKKCAHASCNCTVKEGEKYCSQSCHDARGTTEIGCNCGHPSCMGTNLTR